MEVGASFTRDLLLLCNSPPVLTDNRHPLYNPRHPQNPRESEILTTDSLFRESLINEG